MNTPLIVAVLVAASIASARADDDLVKRGEYLARAGDCIACHTAPGGKPMAGGLGIATPVGVIVSTNITPSRTAGIGAYTFEQFAKALRDGVRADGARLYPAMPYTSYALVTDDDAKALYAYFMRGVPSVDTQPEATRLPFPFDIRASMAVWNAMFLHEGPYRENPAHDPLWNRGAYLVRGLGHCGTCHTPRNLLMAERRSKELAGGKVDKWRAPNITSDPISGVGGWSVDELVRYMRDGHVKDKSQAAGPMAEAVDNSLRFLSTDDLQAMAAFLKSVAPVRDSKMGRAAYEWGGPAPDFMEIRGIAWPSDTAQLNGPQLYDGYCATCHQAHGEGSFDAGLPPLFHNAALGRPEPDNLVLVVLGGIHRALDPPELPMPGFSREMSDQEVATLCSYVLKLYGNGATVSAKQVGDLRSSEPSSNLVDAARLAMGAVVVTLVFIVVAMVRRSRRHRP